MNFNPFSGPRLLLEGSSGANSGYSTPQSTPQQFANIFSQYLPAASNAANQTVSTGTNSLANAAATANPTLTQSGLNQLNTLAPGYQAAGGNLEQAQAGTTAQLLAGNGAQSAVNATNLSNALNPVQQASQNQATNLVNSINLNGLSGGEQNAVERSLNQSNYATGNLGLDNATNAVSNAMNFGNALQAKRTALGSALGTASGVAANQNTFANPVGTALNSGNTSGNFGLSTFNPTQANQFATVPITFASSFGNQTAGVASSSKSANSGGTSSGGVCYLTTACCERNGLSDNCEELTTLRKFRDIFVPTSMVQHYYDSAPYILAKIRKQPDLLDGIYSIVQDCVKDIKAGLNGSAMARYINMVNELETL